MAAPKNFWLFIIIGVLDLVVGLAMSVIVGMTHSWPLAMVLGMGFLITANLMFMLAMKKLG